MTGHYCCISYDSVAFASQFLETVVLTSKCNNDSTEVYIEMKLHHKNKGTRENQKVEKWKLRKREREEKKEKKSNFMTNEMTRQKEKKEKRKK